MCAQDVIQKGNTGRKREVYEKIGREAPQAAPQQRDAPQAPQQRDAPQAPQKRGRKEPAQSDSDFWLMVLVICALMCTFFWVSIVFLILVIVVTYLSTKCRNFCCS